MTAPYRGESSFEVAVGPRAVAELRRAAWPGLTAFDVCWPIAVVALVGAIAADAWRNPMALVLAGVMCVLAVVGARRTQRVARAQMASGRRTRGSIDDDGILLESDGGGTTRWSWDRITFARRTRTALTIFTDTDWAIVILAEQAPNLDRIAELATARAGAPWRASSRWMMVVVAAQIVLTCVALRPRPLLTPHDRIDDALDRHIEPAAADLEVLASGTTCERVDLAQMLRSYRREDLSPAYYDDERATVMAAEDIDRCADGALMSRGRVVIDDSVLGECSYYVFTLRGEDRWVIAGPYSRLEDPAWTHPELGAFDVHTAIEAVTAMHGRILRRMPSSPPYYDAYNRSDEDEDDW